MPANCPIQYKRCVRQVQDAGGVKPRSVRAPLRYSVENPPAIAANWDVALKRRCVAAANFALSQGRTHEQAIAACVLTAGRMHQFGKSGPSVDASFRLGLNQPWTTIGPRETVTLAGGTAVPSQRFKKELIRVGQYVKVSAGLAFQVTMAALVNWVSQFQRMRGNGVKIPMPATHKGTEWEVEAQNGDPRDNMGWVDALWIEGTTLWLSCTLHGEDALKAAARSDVSLNSPPVFVDGKGEIYKWPITHVALCTDPVVPGLGEFVPIAASLGLQSEKGTVIMLEFLKQLAGMLGLNPDEIVDEAAGIKAVVDALTALLEKVGGGSAGADAGAGAGAAAGGAAGGAVINPAGGGQVRSETIKREFAASLSEHPMIVKMLSENRGLKIDALARSGKINADQAKKLRQQWCSDDAIKVSLSAGEQSDRFDEFVSVLEAGPQIIKTGEQTPGQTLTLSDGRKTKPGEKTPVVQDAERRAAAASARK